tara:strand:- start:441 stop:2516 length:2076 start_codon:yes stop_codon:yes gene_type:complete
MKYSEIKLAEKGARKRKQKAAKDKISYQNPNTMSESDITDHMYNVAVNTDHTQYISFTAIDKIGINPRSVYSTPVGIYCYPLTKAGGEPSTILDSMTRDESFDDIPYMKNAPYIYMFEAKNKEKGLILSEYTDEQLEADKQKLYAYLKVNNDQITEDVFNAIIKNSNNEARVKTPGGYLWNLTRHSSLILSGTMEIPDVGSSVIEVGDVVSVYNPKFIQYDYAEVLKVYKEAQSGLFQVKYLKADGSKTDREPVVLGKNDGLILELYQKGNSFGGQEDVYYDDGNNDFILSKSFPQKGDPVRVVLESTGNWYTGYYVGPEKDGDHTVRIFYGNDWNLGGIGVMSKGVNINQFYPIINNIEKNDSVFFALDDGKWSIGTVKTVNKNGSYTIYSGGPDSTKKVNKSAEEVYLKRKGIKKPKPKPKPQTKDSDAKKEFDPKAVEKLFKDAAKTKVVTYAQLSKVLPHGQVSDKKIEDIMKMLHNMGVDIKESSLSTQNQSIINEYSPSRTQAQKGPIQWTAILKSVLKYDYIDDSNNQGIIHENETTQAVFFNAATLSVSETFINPHSTENPIKKVHVDKRPKGGKRGGIFPPDWNKIVQLFSKEKSNGWLNLYRLAYKNSSSNPVITTSDIEKEINLQFTGMSKDATQDLARLWSKQLREKYGISVEDKAAEPKSPDPDDQLNNNPKTAFHEF